MADILSLCSVTYLCGLQSVLCTDKSLLNHCGKGMASRNTSTIHSAELSSVVFCVEMPEFSKETDREKGGEKGRDKKGKK